MKRFVMLLVVVLFLGLIPLFSQCGIAEELVIATVNNPDMMIMKKLSEEFTKDTGIKLNFIVLPENELRQKVTQDVALGAGKYDIVTIGTYDTPFWAANKWIVSLEPYFKKMSATELKEYDRDDFLSPVISALSLNGEQFAIPFYGESSMVFYRKDLFEKHGLTMPKAPTWEEIYKFAKVLHDPANNTYGVVLRGLPGWGQNMAVFGTMINAFGARWFDEKWHPQFDTQEMRNAFQFYKNIITEVGEPGPTTVGFTEALALMSSGRAGMWYDATVAAGFLEGADSKVKGKVAYALAPSAKKKNNGWLWAWSLAIESASKNKDAAFNFITWATSKNYIKLVGETLGWQQAPPGTRTSTYENPNYQAAAPFATLTLDSMKNADYDKPTYDPVPYKGVQYVSIPEFQGLGERVGQELAAYLSGAKNLEDVIQACQKSALEVSKDGGYYKE